MAKEILNNFATPEQIIAYVTDKTKPTSIRQVKAFGPNSFGDKKLWEIWYFKQRDQEYDTCYVTEHMQSDQKVKLNFYLNFSDFAFFLNNQIDEKSNEFNLRKYAMAFAIILFLTTIIYSIIMHFSGAGGIKSQDLLTFVGAAFMVAVGYAFYRKNQNPQS